jgi:hypothetical protein
MAGLRKPRTGNINRAAAILSGQFSRAGPAFRLSTRRGWVLPFGTAGRRGVARLCAPIPGGGDFACRLSV